MAPNANIDVHMHIYGRMESTTRCSYPSMRSRPSLGHLRANANAFGCGIVGSAGGPVHTAHVGIGRRPRREREIRAAQKSARGPVDHYRLGLHPGLRIHDHHAPSLGSEMPVAPREQHPQNRTEVVGALGRDVLVAGRSLIVAATL